MFEWDEEKNRENVAKHGLEFADAGVVFDGPTLTFEDTRFDYGEPRFITFGLLDVRLVVIAHTPTRPHAQKQENTHYFNEKRK